MTVEKMTHFMHFMIALASIQLIHVTPSPIVELTRNKKKENEYTLACKVNLTLTDLTPDAWEMVLIANSTKIENVGNINTSRVVFWHGSYTSYGNYTCQLFNNVTTITSGSLNTTGPPPLKISKRTQELVQVKDGDNATWSFIFCHNSTDFDLVVIDAENNTRDDAVIYCIEKNVPKRKKEICGGGIHATNLKYESHYNVSKKSCHRDETFHLFVSNTDYHIAIKFSLKLFKKPRIQVEGPAKLSVYQVGKNITLKWSILNLEDDELVIQLQFNGSESGINYSLLNTSKRCNEGHAYVPYNLNASETGVLTLNVTNKGGSDVSQLNLCVSDGPSVFTQSSVSPLKYVEEGNNATFTCHVSTCNYNHSAGIQWFYFQNESGVGTPINNYTEDLGKFAIKSTVSIAGVQSGYYICMAQPLSECSGCITQQHFIIMVQNKAQRQTPTSDILPLPYLIALTSVVVTLIVSITCIIGFIYVRRQLSLRSSNAYALLQLQKGDYSTINDEIPLNEQALALPFDINWGFPSDKLRLGTQLGSGNYGLVLSATAYGLVPGERKSCVAVKMAKQGEDLQTMSLMVAELKIMSNLGRHVHIVNLLGAVVDKIAQHQLMIIVELCPYGNLKNYLIENRYRFVDDLTVTTLRRKEDKRVIINTHTDMPFNTQVLISWGFQVAKGMEWLASKRVVHGDLAARNILLTTGNIVKISDFGLAKNLYNEYVKEKDQEKTRLPVMWMALESVRDGKFSTKSDVWSYGIAMWEIFSLGAMPYTEFESFRELWRNLQQGYRLEKPKYAPQAVFSIMWLCWEARPESRPPFSDISCDMHNLLDAKVEEEYLTEVEKLKSIKERTKSLGPAFLDTMYPDLNSYQDVSSEQRDFPRPYSYIETLEMTPKD